MSTFNIRRGVFETNSSSQHALSVFKKSKDTLENVPEKVELVLSQYQFGWDEDEFSSFDDKLAYLWLAAGDAEKSDRESMQNEIKALLYAVGVKEIDIRERDEYDREWDWGYIDHGDEAVEFVQKLLKEPDLFYGWLFNDRSLIGTSNDNDGGDPKERWGADYIYYKGN